MPSKVYEIMNSAIQNADLLHSGRLLIEFANLAYKENDRTNHCRAFLRANYTNGRTVHLVI
jgi:hypothetical protein